MYCGRFAPTPSGRLHLGSLLSAAGAYLRALSQGGECLLRLEDLDRPRCRPEYKDSICADLKTLGFTFSGQVLVQSDDLNPYQEAVEQLLSTGKAFVCRCSRRQIRERPCQCRELNLPYKKGRAIRLDCEDVPRDFYDERLCSLHLSLLPDSLILKRSDGIFSYNLACVVDDVRQHITEVVRGSDLISSTPLQIYLYHLLGRTPPKFLHLPLIVAADGGKLSKQNHAQPVLERFTPAEAVRLALKLLGQSLDDLQGLTPSEMWQQAASRFDLAAIPRQDITLNLQPVPQLTPAPGGNDCNQLTQ